MKAKVWLTVFGIISFLAIGGSAYFVVSSYGKYSGARTDWEEKVNTIESLERRVPYPNTKNEDSLREKVDVYRTSVDSLLTTLKSFQREFNMDLRNTDFQQLIKTRVQDFRQLAAKEGLEIESDTEFQLGFDAYANSVPAQDLVPVLDYELEAIDFMLRKLVESDAVKLSNFERDPIPGEAGGEEVPGDAVVHKYPVRFRFRGSHDSLQKFVNQLANDKQFFYIVRVLKVKNEVTEGPAKLTAGGGTGYSKFENPLTKEVATPEMVAEWRGDGASDQEVEEKAKAAGFIKADVDARVLMGQEQLDVFMVVDIARFLSAEELAEKAPETETKRSKK